MALIIEARLGRGRTVETFAAKLDERPVVIKRARAELAHNRTFVEALAAWGEDQQRLRHLSLASVLGVERSAEGVMVVQERVDGASLSAVLRALKKSRRSFHPAMALGIAREIASTLAYLHTAEVHHGGIDPGEVILSYAGQTKLTDPMLRSLDEIAGNDLDPVQEVSLYRAPEARGAANDVYAAGLVLLEMLLGQPLWTKEKMTVAAAVSALKDYTALGQAQPELTERLTQLLRGCLKEDAGDRINAVVMVAAIEHVLAHHQLGFEPSALGALVKAAVPPPDTADAPTMMVDPTRIEAQAQAQAARVAQLESASVAVDPELEHKAMTRAGRPASSPEGGLPLAVVTPSRSSGTPGLVMAPSIKREKDRVPDVARVAMQAQAAFDNKGPDRRTVIAVLGGMFLVFLLWIAFGGNDEPVRLMLESDPPGAVVLLDGEILGVTPFDRLMELEGNVVKLQFELDGYEPHTISIGTEEKELRYEARLKKKGE
jgi:hypothetical protein